MQTRGKDLFSQVLIVDDDELSNFISKSFLEMSGLTREIAIAKNGKIACRFLENPDNPTPSIILLDINMPVMNGLEFLDYYEENGLCGLTKIAMLTSSVAPEDKYKASRCSDVIGYIEKPLQLPKINALAKNYNLTLLNMDNRTNYLNT